MPKDDRDKAGPAGRPATMVDVAARAGVSLKTVSRVLNKQPFVTESLRQQVLKAAEALDYRFNHAARSLRAASRLIVLAVDHPGRSAYLESVHLGALKECQRQNVQLFLASWQAGAADCARMLETQRPLGVVLVPALCDNQAVLALLAEHDIPCVLIAPNTDAADQPAVFMDDESAAREATAMLIRLGHRRIGLIAGRPGHGASRRRLDGYRAALAAAGLPLDEGLIQPGDFEYDTSLASAEALLDLPDRPTAIFAGNDDMAAAVLTAAYRRSIKVPDELSVVGFDDTPIAAIITPNLTTVRQPIEAMAAAAVRLLAQRMSGVETPVGSVTLEHALVHRASTGPPPSHGRVAGSDATAGGD